MQAAAAGVLLTGAAAWPFFPPLPAAVVTGTAADFTLKDLVFFSTEF